MTARSRVSARVFDEEISSLTPIASAAASRGRNCSLQGKKGSRNEGKRREKKEEERGAEKKREEKRKEELKRREMKKREMKRGEKKQERRREESKREERRDESNRYQRGGKERRVEEIGEKRRREKEGRSYLLAASKMYSKQNTEAFCCRIFLLVCPSICLCLDLFVRVSKVHLSSSL